MSRKVSSLLLAIVVLQACHHVRRDEPVVSSLPKRCVLPVPQMTDEAVNASVAKRRDRGFLWKATRGPTTSWLYGAIHINKPEWTVPGPAFFEAWEQTDVLALEMTPEQLQAMAASTASTAASTPAKPPKADPFVRAAAEAMCLPSTTAENLAKFPLWVQASALLSLDSSRVGLWSAYASDFVLGGMASASNKPVVGLETEAEQTAAVTELMAPDIESLHQLANQIVEQKTLSLYEGLAAAWSEGNLEEMSFRAMCPNCDADPKQAEAYKHGIIDRNHRQAERFTKLHDEGKRVLCAVGSAHMLAPEGIPELLKKQGFTVERVQFKDVTNETLMKSVP